MSCKCGIIGLPNVGKSTLFNILTKSKIPAKNFPFCTIKPNIGFATVIDMRLNQLSEIVNPKNVVNSFIEFIDIAGLVKGASQGSGLGNDFLSHIQKTDIILHVVRCFEDNNIIHVHDQIKPEYDIDIINMELILSDLNTCQRELLKFKNKKNNVFDINNKTINILNLCLNHLKNMNMIKTLELNTSELALIKNLNFITLKPIMYVINIINNKKNNIFFKKLCNSGLLENNLFIKLDILKEHQDHNIILKNSNVLNCVEYKNSKIHQIIKLAYNLLNLQNFFTVGKKEIRSWTIRKGISILDAAKKIHSDFKKGFIRAQVMSFIDFIKFRGENKLKEIGKIRSEGKKYIVQDGDIIKFLFQV